MLPSHVNFTRKTIEKKTGLKRYKNVEQTILEFYELKKKLIVDIDTFIKSIKKKSYSDQYQVTIQSLENQFNDFQNLPSLKLSKIPLLQGSLRTMKRILYQSLQIHKDDESEINNLISKVENIIGYISDLQNEKKILNKIIAKTIKEILKILNKIKKDTLHSTQLDCEIIDLETEIQNISLKLSRITPNSQHIISLYCKLYDISTNEIYSQFLMQKLDKLKNYLIQIELNELAIHQNLEIDHTIQHELNTTSPTSVISNILQCDESFNLDSYILNLNLQ